ncbi:hypothetical protein M378DRAFT_174464 [Amanita muscaria Koide BX008]|uniref:Uncharacterized protein n=1 Tax=Amanita muscaria (strain Koide BX008) TaxID=946122 RepID=A0A0C2WDF9_AMAMK|nr:hypothetical protein M378DRAFT_174464 [Amanita muscaria Koide BX008]
MANPRSPFGAIAILTSKRFENHRPKMQSNEMPMIGDETAIDPISQVNKIEDDHETDSILYLDPDLDNDLQIIEAAYQFNCPIEEEFYCSNFPP